MENKLKELKVTIINERAEKIITEKAKPNEKSTTLSFFLIKPFSLPLFKGL